MKETSPPPCFLHDSSQRSRWRPPCRLLNGTWRLLEQGEEEGEEQEDEEDALSLLQIAEVREENPHSPWFGYLKTKKRSHSFLLQVLQIKQEEDHLPLLKKMIHASLLPYIVGMEEEGEDTLPLLSEE